MACYDLLKDSAANQRDYGRISHGLRRPGLEGSHGQVERPRLIRCDISEARCLA